MGFRLRWSAPAQRDLDDLQSYIAAHNPDAAQRFSENLVQRVRQLRNFPELGSMVLEFPDRSLRQIIYGSYRRLYRVNASADEVEIIRIWHAARGTPDVNPQ